MEDRLPRAAPPRAPSVAPGSRNDDFVGVVGRAVHDLRGPLAVIEGWAAELELVVHEGTPAPAHAAQLVGRIRAAAEEARSLADALLADAAVRAREPVRERVDLTALAHDVAVSQRGRAQVSVREVGVVPGDPVLLRRLLVNLVDNAVKYVPEGAVPRVTISGEPVGSDLRITVADLGIGIPAGQHTRIFDDFERASAVHAGTGLGLSICRRIAEQHGGRICAHDRDDDRDGAVFEITVPAWEPPNQPPDREGRQR